MSSITIHDMDDNLDGRLSEEARKRKTSKNRLVKELLSKALGLPTGGSRRDEYDEFLGLWSADEALEFARSQRENGRVDPEEWLT